MTRILVIKLAALGDVVQAFPAFHRIRAAHPGAELTLLTTPPYASLAGASGVFDRIETDGRPGSMRRTVAMLRRLRRTGYDRVYDLQTSTRSSAYFYALGPGWPEWSGIAPGCSHPHGNPDRNRMHTLERLAEQLEDAGVWPDAPISRGTSPAPDLSFMLSHGAADKTAERYALASPYALLIPGASASRPGKRWPLLGYGELAGRLVARGLQVGVVGGPGEVEIGRAIAAASPRVTDLTGRTDYAELAALGAGAALAIGNDTGPTHLIASTGASTLVLSPIRLYARRVGERSRC